jgi:hypothetical protein
MPLNLSIRLVLPLLFITTAIAQQIKSAWLRPWMTAEIVSLVVSNPKNCPNP